MSQGITLGQEIIIELLKRFPNAPNKTLARIAYRDFPSVWSTLNATYCCVRHLRGNGGAKSRMYRQNVKFRRPNGNSGFIT